EQLAGALDRQFLGLVDFLAAAVVAPPRVAFSIFVGEHRARGLEHSTRHDVLRGDQLDLFALAMKLAVEHCGNGRVALANALREEGRGFVGHPGGSLAHVDPFESLATRPAWRPPSNSVARKTFSASRAVSGPIRRAPNATTLASLCWRVSRA